MIKVFTNDKGEYLEKRFTDILKELDETEEYAFCCGQLEAIIAQVIAELRN